MSDRPNILVMTSHDTGRHFGCYGVAQVRTPAIDGLAAEGCVFTNYFATGSVCAPSRGCMMTGRYPQSNGLMEMPRSALTDEPLFPWDWAYNEGERHLSHILRDAGFHTALIGFQHEAFLSDTLGFDSRHAEMRPWSVLHPGDVVAAAATEFFEDRARRREPFYAQVGFFETHRPFSFGGVEADRERGVHVPPFLAENDANVKELALMQGAIRKLDESVGAILDALRSTGLERDTIVVFTVDHGIPFPRAKKFLYDPGIGVALIVRWPGRIRGGQSCERLLSNVDFLPTLLKLVDVPVPGNVEGLSFADVFGPDGGAPQRDAIFASFLPEGRRCVRTERFKLIRNFAWRQLLRVPVESSSNPKSTREKCPAVQLFDLERDPSELRSVADDPAYREVRKDLDAKLWSWLEEVNDPILRGPAPTPSYFEAIADYSEFRAGRCHED